jgi:hypothetical protein
VGSNDNKAEISGLVGSRPPAGAACDLALLPHPKRKLVSPSSFSSEPPVAPGPLSSSASAEKPEEDTEGGKAGVLRNHYVLFHQIFPQKYGKFCKLT